LEYDDLLELYGYDEERGLSKLVLEKGIEIEDEYGAITWVAGMVTSTQGGTLDFQVKFPGSAIDSGTWTQTRNRAEMETTWRLPPALRRRQPSVHAILTMQGYTPWHHPQHGSHWLRLQPRGAWNSKTHDVHGIPQCEVYGWRMGLSMMNMDDENSGGHDFDMCSFVEDHMSKEDLGTEASKQDWTLMYPSRHIVCCLLIPFPATWTHHVKEGETQVDDFVFCCLVSTDPGHRLCVAF